MARFLTTTGSIAQIEEVITSARQELHLITPFVQLTDFHIRRLRDADERGISATLVCRYRELRGEDRAFFHELENLRVFDDPGLHAKCFINEHGLVLTSLNLYGASEKNNEMGVWLSAEADKEAYRRAVEEARSIREHAHERVPNSVRGTTGRHAGKSNGRQASAEQDERRRSDQYSQSGYCIRCRTQVDYDPSRPYCWNCFQTWAEYQNPLFEDRHCHSCGKPDGGYTMEKPECYSCYRDRVTATA